MSARTVEDRITFMREHPPNKPGMCARTTWLALGVPALGLPDAAAVTAHIRRSGHLQKGSAPRGAIMLWEGGHSGHGHMAMSLGGGRVLSTDVNHPGGVGEQSFEWFAHHWPAEHYAGWSSWYGVPLPM